MAPQVRDLQALIAEQAQAIAPQKALLDADITRNAESGVAQERGLGASKDQAFTQIEQTASNKGMFFSGFSPNEQAQYTAGTYLPALAQLQQTIAATRSNILGKKADLDTDVFRTASSMRESDVSALNSWNAAERQRQFEAEQNRLKMEASARESAADRAAASANARAGAASKAGPTAAQQMASAMGSKVGRDGYVSPGTYAANKQMWVSGGYGSSQQFDQTFAGFRNPKDKGYRIG